MVKNLVLVILVVALLIILFLLRYFFIGITVIVGAILVYYTIRYVRGVHKRTAVTSLEDWIIGLEEKVNTFSENLNSRL